MITLLITLWSDVAVHRGMLYEPPSSIATPFFVAISGFQGFTGLIALFQKAEKCIEKAKDTDYEPFGLLSLTCFRSKSDSILPQPDQAFCTAAFRAVVLRYRTVYNFRYIPSFGVLICSDFDTVLLF